jgi:hypothetical protein
MIAIRNIGILEKYTLKMCSCIALLPAIHGSICSFWKNISGPMINLFWVRFACNHSYGYAHAHNVIMGRIVQTDSLTDFIKYAHCLHSYEMSGLNDLSVSRYWTLQNE